MQRSIERAEAMDIEGIKYVPWSGKSEREIARDYFRHIPNRAFRRLVDKKFIKKKQ